MWRCATFRPEARSFSLIRESGLIFRTHGHRGADTTHRARNDGSLRASVARRPPVVADQATHVRMASRRSRGTRRLGRFSRRKSSDARTRATRILHHASLRRPPDDPRAARSDRPASRREPHQRIVEASRPGADTQEASESATTSKSRVDAAMTGIAAGQNARRTSPESAGALRTGDEVGVGMERLLHARK
jgi:hypothetical protein